MTDNIQVVPLPVTVDVEPRAGSSTVLYSPLAPQSGDAKPRVMIALILRVTNHGSRTLTFKRLKVSFAGPPFVASSVYGPEDALGNSVVITPGATKNFHFSRLVTILFTTPAPPGMTLSLTFEESTQVVTVFRHLAPHSNPVAGGAYRLPFRSSDMPAVAVVGGSSGHRGGNQRFAYDLGVAQWDPASEKWRGLRPGATENTNENQVDWELPVYAMADGVVVSAENGVPDNPHPPASITGGGGNHLVIRHGAERVLYAHFRQGSVSPELLQVGAPVTVGQPVAKQGNSGSSTGCHLHIHAVDDATGFFRPLLFRGAWLSDRKSVDPGDLSGPWRMLEGHGLPFGRNAVWPNRVPPDLADDLDDFSILEPEDEEV